MKPTPILLAGLLIAMLALAGCQGRNDQPSEPSSSEESSASSSTGTATAPVDEEHLTTAMEGIFNYEPGTAGSSLKVYISAAGLLNFTETYEEDQQDTLRAAIQAYLGDLDAEGRQRFADNLMAVDITAREIISGEREGTKDMLEEAGNPQEHEHYDLSKYEPVKLVLDDELEAILEAAAPAESEAE